MRLGHPRASSPALATLTIDAQIDADGATTLAREWRDRARALRKTALGKRGAAAKELWQEARALDRDAAREIANAERAIVDRADVILATCVGCDHPLLGETVFDAVVVDEATQAPDPLLLIALARAKVCVLAGDQQQLGPVVIGGPAAEATLGTTVFERLASSRERHGDARAAAPHARGDHDVPVALDVRRQAASPRPRSLRTGSTTSASCPIRCGLARSGSSTPPARTGSRSAPTSIPAARSTTWRRSSSTRARSTRATPSASPPKRAACCRAGWRRPRSRSSRRTRRRRGGCASCSRAERAAGLEIGTVDGFQGREKEAVIVDLVRSNEYGEIGFLANTRRMNVALTRAKRFLLVIADSATLGEHPYYAAFLQYVDEIDAHGSAWSDEAPPLP